MELTKNIFFNTDKLVENSKVKLSYTGKFFQENCADVYIHYGFGESWENVNEVKMEKTELGFQTEINLIPSECFNFCFKNGNNEWDNNNFQNYSFPIEKGCTDLIVTNNNEYSISKPKHLRKSYIWSKKIRLAIYKAITYLPKIISGNYRRKIVN